MAAELHDFPLLYQADFVPQAYLWMRIYCDEGSGSCGVKLPFTPKVFRSTPTNPHTESMTKSAMTLQNINLRPSSLAVSSDELVMYLTTPNMNTMIAIAKRSGITVRFMRQVRNKKKSPTVWSEDAQELLPCASTIIGIAESIRRVRFLNDFLLIYCYARISLTVAPIAFAMTQAPRSTAAPTQVQIKVFLAVSSSVGLPRALTKRNPE